MTRELRRHGRRSGAGLVILLILLGLFLAIFASAFRARPQRRIHPRHFAPPIVTPHWERDHRWLEDESEVHTRLRWQSDWETSAGSD